MASVSSFGRFPKLSGTKKAVAPWSVDIDSWRRPGASIGRAPTNSSTSCVGTCPGTSIRSVSNSGDINSRTSERLELDSRSTCEFNEERFGNSVAGGSCSKSLCRTWPLTRSFKKGASQNLCLKIRRTLDEFNVRRSHSVGVGSREKFCKLEHGEHRRVETQMVYFTHDSLIHYLPGVLW